MDYNYITNQEGYRVEDLTKQNQDIMSWLNYVLDQFKDDTAENISECYLGEAFEDDSTIGQIILEIEEKFKTGVEAWLLSQIQEIQIYLAENEEDGGDPC